MNRPQPGLQSGHGHMTISAARPALPHLSPNTQGSPLSPPQVSRPVRATNAEKRRGRREDGQGPEVVPAPQRAVSGRWAFSTSTAGWDGGIRTRACHPGQDKVGSWARAAVTEVPGSRELGGAGLRLTQESRPSQSADRQKHLLAITRAWPFLDVP